MDTTGAAEPPATLEAALQAVFAGAEVVFTGEVLSIEHTAGAVIVRWHIEDAVRGVTAGEYDLREWAGLWTGDSARYTVGERALVLLHAPSVAGFASPVGGLDGIIPLRGDAAGSLLDLRWLAQHAVVTDAPRLRPALALRMAGGSVDLANALLARSANVVKIPADPVETGPQQPILTTTPASFRSSAQVDGAVVLSMLHAWQRASGGPH